MRIAAAMLLLIALLLATGCQREAPPPATQPASQPATAPATQPAELTYVDVIRASYPKMPATQPLGIPADLKDAGHYLLPEPVYLCPRGDLWITRPDAPPTPSVLEKAPDEQIHLIRERVRFVHWGLDEQDKPLTRAVVKSISGADAWAQGNRMFPLKMSGYRWDRVRHYGASVIVPSERGVSVFTFTPEPNENYQEIVTAKDGAPPEILLDPRGVLAWSPWDDGKAGGEGAWRFVDDQWVNLASRPNWNEKFIHLVPLLDGSVLQLLHKDGGKVGLALSIVDAPTLDESIVNQLIEQLSDDDPDKRDAAYAELTRYGPASWPILEKQLENQGPEAQIRMRQLLRNRTAPTLGGRNLLDGVARVATRFDDGGLLLFAPAGVSTPRQDKPPEITRPAWISIRPGRAIELLEPVLTKDANPDKQRIFAFDNEWIIADKVQGPRRLLGNHLEPMLNKDESAYVHVIGYDRRGRWLFKKSSADAQTLILDPTLPDTTPRLPVWLIVVKGGQTGWTKDNWPAIKRGGAWALHETGWRPLDEKKEQLITRLPGAAVRPVVPDAPVVRVAPAPRRFAATRATTMTTTRSTTTRATAGQVTTTRAAATTSPVPAPDKTTADVVKLPPQSREELILIDREGRRYFDGKQSLRVIDKAGREIVWQLPPNSASVSDFPTVLIQTEDGLLFLFNERGRVVRIKPTPGEGAGAGEPFIVEAIFTHQIPSSDDIRRIWLDPAGRIIIAYEATRLAILFPQGRIPPQIATLMLAPDENRKP